MNFEKAFEFLTGHQPFPWQNALFQRVVAGNIPISRNIPTGLGKTNVTETWLIAWSKGVNVPRWLVYVVNRHTVVQWVYSPGVVQ